ncbi:MAG: MarC family protein [Candidatus Diapherotrites archaeon]|uniref:UPF0056 membrane protein n=2 Tax=Candidatus Iainarchaeum sp. TaxID=3101447 RepID=A0A8T4KXT7_9ARCH|nr:MarC family protein [Candidatus Diapherotrites archaeon]
MFGNLLQLIVLFFVIFDPLLSAAVFFTASKKMRLRERKKTAFFAVSVAALISFIVLLSGNAILELFNTNINDFRVAGGIILLILGVKMALGVSITNPNQLQKNSSKALAAVIGTPLITGPAAITAIIISTSDYGILQTSTAIAIVLAFTLVLLYALSTRSKMKGETAIQVLSTILGLVTIAWGIDFIRTGLLLA